ncbi:MAG: hypothetical protein LBD29_05335 [Treponema sp.]|jgi:hypothetical protein|nr:hypothetical protein [Treponema sp.]
MKKIMIGLLTLAITGGLFAEDEGLKINGLISTGLRFSFVQDFIDDWGAPNATRPSDYKGNDSVHNTLPDPPYYNGPDRTTWTRANKAPSAAVWHEDHGAVRLMLNGSYTGENYGLVFRTILKPYEWWKAVNNNGNDGINKGDLKDRALELMDQGYVWSEFVDKKIRMSAGRIKDGSFWYSDGLGLRFDFRPINGLLFGFLLDGKAGMANLTHGDNWRENKLSQEDGISNWMVDFFRETSFGVQYNHELFSVNAAFKLDSEGDGLEEWDASGWETRRFGGRPADHESDAGKGMKAFLGVWIRAVPKVPMEVTAEIMNINGFNDFGWVKLGEKVGFSNFPLNVELYMEQFIFGSHALWSAWGIFNHGHPDLEYDEYNTGKVVYTNPMPRLLFQPSGSYALNDRWTVGCGIPIIIWPDNFLEVSVNPWVGFKIGDKAYLSASYKFMFLQHDKTYRSAADIDPWINHHIQLKYEWRF